MMNKEEEVCVMKLLSACLSWSFDFKVVFVVGDGRLADADEHCSLNLKSLSLTLLLHFTFFAHTLHSFNICCLHFDFFFFHVHVLPLLLQRKKGFKKSIDIDEGRRRREETTLQIRKTKKDVRLAKRRQMPSSAMGMEGGGGMDTPAALAAASMLAAGGVAPGGYGE